MSSSSTHYSSGNASYSSSSSHSNTLLLHRNNIKEHEDTLSNPKDILSQPEDALPHLADNLAHSADALPLHATALPHLADNLPHSADALPLHETASPHLVDVLSQPKVSTMPDSDRSKYRNVHIFNASDRNTIIGGLILTTKNDETNCVTNANFYAMVEIITVPTSAFTLRNESDVAIEKDNSPLQPGKYYIHASEPFQLSDEVVLSRALSIQTGTRTRTFCDAVRLRDRRCVITGEEYLDNGDWAGFKAAHIFPLAYEQQWIDYNYSRWISTPLDGEQIKGGTINSVKNGLLLESAVHDLFELYRFSINPDDNYKIVFFQLDRKGLAGKYLDRRLLDDPQRPAEQLLRWHFRQAVLTNMRGAGEPQFEHDFPPGSDMMGSILKGPKAAERMEFELFGRLAAEVDLTQ